ncbi:MAG: hypothetical protein ACXWP0_09275 [Ktedonobacterales bacterium]
MSRSNSLEVAGDPSPDAVWRVAWHVALPRRCGLWVGDTGDVEEKLC